MKSVDFGAQKYVHKAHCSYILTNLPLNHYFNHEDYQSRVYFELQ